MFLIFFFLGTSSETRVDDSDKATTSTVDTEVKITLPELEAPTTTAKRLQASGETTVVVVEDSSSNIDEKIKELSQAGGLWSSNNGSWRRFYKHWGVVMESS